MRDNYLNTFKTLIKTFWPHFLLFFFSKFIAKATWKKELDRISEQYLSLHNDLKVVHKYLLIQAPQLR